MSVPSRPARWVPALALAGALALAPGSALAAGPGATAAAATVAGALTLAVDANEAPRGILHARLSVPVSQGPLTLAYPKWIPGEHAPTGPITDVVGLELRAGGRVVPWRRDSVEMFAVHLTVPPGVHVLEASYNFLLPSGGQFSGGVSSTQQLVMVSWNQVALYPVGRPTDDILVAASLSLPPGWGFGTALPHHGGEAAGTIHFDTVSLSTLVDSPVLAGAFFRTLRLNEGLSPPAYLDMAADSREALAIRPQEQAALSRLVAEAGELFGARHYREYHFLVTLSDHTAHFGLEHHESSDDRMSERTWLESDLRLFHSNLLPHEYVHSWNGKYRRPAGLATADFLEPMRDELLWVYEGLTQYLGFVLGARSGVRDASATREWLAYIAAQQELHRGRAWRPLIDTAIAAQLLYAAPEAWQALRRGTDFYNEGVLLWLEADALIRRESGGARSLDDFCHRFHGGGTLTGHGGAPHVKPYTLDEVVATLNEVEPHDWRAFIDEHLERTAAHAPLAGIEAAGWRLGWADTLTAFNKAVESAGKHTEMQYSIGLLLHEDGGIIDVMPASAAARAGMGPGMKLLAVNGRRYSAKVLRAAVKATRGAMVPLELLAENDEYFRTFRLDYREGEKYPVLVRTSGTPDLLGRILAPRAAAAPAR